MPGAVRGAAFPRYAIALLFVVYTLNFLDRQIINILAEPIKRDLGLADWQLGAVTGLAFAILYTILGIPIARLADRLHRGRIIAAALLVWSCFTVLCGTATSFAQLLLYRVGVGVGEAGCSPAAQSLITDITVKANRARALSVYAMGVPVGSLLGMVIGGLAVDIWGWRHALLLVGIPGIAVSIIAFLTLHDPRFAIKSRGEEHPIDDVPGLKAACREILSKKSFWWMSAGAALTAFVGYGHQTFFASFFLRNHDGDLHRYAEYFGLGVNGFLGVSLGLLLGVGGSIGAYFGGAVTDRYVERRPTISAIVPAIGALAAVPFFIIAFLLPSGLLALGILVIPTIFKNFWLGPVYAHIQSVVHQRSRATATALFLFILNAFGLGLGPISIGLLSDILSQSLGDGEGLRWAMIALTSMSALSAGCFWMARRTIVADQV